jgi:hypothetical protein
MIEAAGYNLVASISELRKKQCSIMIIGTGNMHKWFDELVSENTHHVSNLLKSKRPIQYYKSQFHLVVP